MSSPKVSLRRHIGLLYGILVVMIVSIGAWWVVFLTHEGRSYEREQMRLMEIGRLSAEHLVRTVPGIRDDPAGNLGEIYPYLSFSRSPAGPRIQIDPVAIARVKREAGRRQRMFTAEGIFFLFLLAAGVIILSVAYRSEQAFKRARELFLAGATHELRTPLASLRLYTETLERPELDRREAARVRRRMLQDLGRLEDLIDQVLATAHEEEAGPEPLQPVDLAAITTEVLKELEGFLSSHGARVDLSLPAGHRILTSRFIFSLVLRNLLTNAVLHSPPPARVTISLTRNGSWHELAVQDQGPGIPRKYRERIFQGFVRLPDHSSQGKTTGSGLGLYLVKRKVEMMGGKVKLDSAVGRGSTFTLLWPAYGEDGP